MIKAGYQISNKYFAVDVIAAGQIGIVVQIRDRNGSGFALKTIKPQIIKTDPTWNVEKLIRGIKREADFLRAFRHANIVQLKETIQDPLLGFCIIMEYANGGTLKQKIRKKRMSIEKSLHIIECLLDALKFLHSGCPDYPAGIVHLDIEPKNILFDHCGNLKLCDFHFSRELRFKDDSSEFPTERHPIDVRTDICQIGTLFYEMLAFIETKEIEYYALLALFRPIIRKMTAENISKRYQQIDDVYPDFLLLKNKLVVV